MALRKIVTFGQYEEPKEKAPKRVQVDKFEYIYGAYDIGLYGKEYHPTGIYVSKPHNMAGNIMQVVLEAEEEHPVFYKNYREGQDLRRGIIQRRFGVVTPLLTLEIHLEELVLSTTLQQGKSRE